MLADQLVTALRSSVFHWSWTRFNIQLQVRSNCCALSVSPGSQWAFYGHSKRDLPGEGSAIVWWPQEKKLSSPAHSSGVYHVHNQPSANKYTEDLQMQLCWVRWKKFQTVKLKRSFTGLNTGSFKIKENLCYTIITKPNKQTPKI